MQEFILENIIMDQINNADQMCVGFFKVETYTCSYYNKCK